MSEQIQKPNLIEMAKKRRHLHLVEKLSRGKSQTPSLSKSEIKELENLESIPGAPTIVKSHDQVAKIFGVSVRTVDRWVKDGMPITNKGHYDLIEIRAWREIKNQKRSKSEKKKSQDEWDSHFREFKARIAEINYKKAIGELVSKAIVEKEIIQLSTGIKRNLLALPKKIAPQLVGLDTRQINALLTIRIREAIKDIYDGKIQIKKVKHEKTNLNADNLDAEGQERVAVTQ